MATEEGAWAVICVIIYR